MNNKNNHHVKFSSFFSAEDIICRTLIVDRDDLIMDLCKLLAFNRGIGNVKQAYKAIIEREEDQHTIVKTGIALPHARLESISNLAVAIATAPHGIHFKKGHEPVKVVVMILAPKDEPALYLQALASLSHIFSEKDAVDAVADLGTAEEIWKFFDRGGVVLPDYVCAGDIMETNPDILKENDTLAHAIDLFVKKNTVSIPVVDKDGDLVGVVTAQELLRVSLPDYILWMDDLSPIIHFEPFANVLRNEKNTWLAEIMSQEYAVVSEEAPAIQVAMEIAKHNTRRAFVLRGKKLVGVITLQHFLAKVLRE